jgi:Icc-related predicted phosphoesterase
MRLLHVSDFHCHRPWFSWLATHAGECDACCLTGDLLDLFLDSRPRKRITLSHQSRWVRDWLEAWTGPPLYVCSGNHDAWLPAEGGDDPLARLGFLRLAAAANARIKIDGTDEVFGGHRFVCCPWGRVPTLAETPDPVVLLSHTPPDGTQVAAGGMGSGAAEMDLADAVRRLPAGSLVLSGHVHHPDRWHDRLGVAVCFNPGVDESAEVPCHIVIDTARCTAVFHEDEESRGPIGW